MTALEINVNGIVQGVGFRPFIATLARELGLNGWVRNDADGVHILAQGEQPVLESFVSRIEKDAPAAAHILFIETRDTLADETLSGFEIVASKATGSRETLVSPDLATCPDCLAELFDPKNRRFHYPFINCTACGPRFTIIDDLPYDRAVTSMRGFTMCEPCADEYADPLDRRYHAQPDACFDCGPHLNLVDADTAREGGSARIAQDVTESDALIAETMRMLEAGKVLAIKGLGGWHLSCSARSDSGIAALRERKRRPSKPLAVMVRDIEAARRLCFVSEAEAEQLESPARPIVLLQRKPDADIGRGIAADLPELGLMLPATPVQHLIFALTDEPLVMTSGNRSGEPIVAEDRLAYDALGSIADAFLGNDRPIVARYDDSVVRVCSDGHIQIIRRARGFAPAPLFVSDGTSGDVTILACGPEQKSTLCYLKGKRAYLSQHLGDLETRGSWEAWEQTRERYGKLFDLNADVIACDKHPEYLASKWARSQEAPLIEMQHHHAHIVSVMGENALDGNVIGVALDGTGYGDDGHIWGCEILVADRLDFERAWHLPEFPLPGGVAAIRDPRRVGYALLRTFGYLDDPRFSDFLAALPERDLLDQMIEKGLNCPKCSSLGRLFDGAAALLGLVDVAGYDGEPACLLEAAAHAERAGGEPCSPFTALSFHERVAEIIIDETVRVAADRGISDVALSGGCLVNRILRELLLEGLRKQGLTVYENQQLPCNDGCIAYGQAIGAAAHLANEKG